MFSDLNGKRFITAIVSLFVATIVFATIVTPLGGAHLPWLLSGLSFDPPVVFGQLLTLMVVTYIYTRHIEGRGVNAGVRFGTPLGLLLGLVFIGGVLGNGPVDVDQIFRTLIVMLGYGMVSGIVLSLTYPKK